MYGHEPDEAGIPLSEREADALRGIEQHLQAAGLRLRARDVTPAWQNMALALAATVAMAVSVFLIVHGYRMGTGTGAVTTWLGFNGLCQSIGMAIAYRQGLWSLHSVVRQGKQWVHDAKR